MQPYVILHMGISLDGRIDWGGSPDSPYYELVEQFGADADLTGSNTMLKAPFPDDPQQALGGLYQAWIQKPKRPMLVSVDSKGRIKNWEIIKKQPFWQDHVSLCSKDTPKSHVEYLDSAGVTCIMAGDHEVDLRKALEELNFRFGVQRIRVDSGGILNGALLRQGLVSEVSVILNPCLVGGTSPQTMFVAPDLEAEAGVIALTLSHIETIRDRFVWLRYQIQKQ